VLKTAGNIFSYVLWRNVTIAVIMRFSEFGEKVKEGDNFSPGRISWLSCPRFLFLQHGSISYTSQFILSKDVGFYFAMDFYEVCDGGHHCVGLEVRTPIIMNASIFWDVAPCSSKSSLLVTACLVFLQPLDSVMCSLRQ
jgi:hypothetical protein